MYAGDVCLMAPIPAALQELINICYDFSVRNNLSFNSAKSYKLSCLILYNIRWSQIKTGYTHFSNC